jgi:hypothetical protein
MISVFVVCTAVGTTVLALQFLLALIGLGGDAMGADAPHDFGHDAGGLDHDLADGAHGEVGHGGHAGGHEQSHHSASAHRSVSIFRALSLRSVTAALAFFGLAGLAANSAHCSPHVSLAIAGAAGLGALYGVYFLLNAMRSLRAEGTVRIQRALGKEATVYLHIPGNRKGRGKIQINLQNRTMEYLATTAGEPIPTGATVVVTEVLGSDMVEVEKVVEKLSGAARDSLARQPEVRAQSGSSAWLR